MTAIPKALRGETKPDLLTMAEIERLKARIAELDAGPETRRRKRELRYAVKEAERKVDSVCVGPREREKL